MNTETLTPSPLFVKWISPNAIQRGVSHSSIRIGFTDANQAKQAVEKQIFYGRYNKKTEFGRKSKPRCMNCLQDGHTSNHCKKELMCPYCAEPHPADGCKLKGLMTSNCTACARSLKSAKPDTNLKELFSTTPVSLSHSPLDPTCPTRAALKRAEAAATTNAARANNTDPASTPQAVKAGAVLNGQGDVVTPTTLALQGGKTTATIVEDTNMSVSQ